MATSLGMAGEVEVVDEAAQLPAAPDARDKQNVAEDDEKCRHL